MSPVKKVAEEDFMRTSGRNNYSEFLEFALEDVVSGNVRRFVDASGFTAEELSYRSNLSIATIYRLRSGQNITIRGICALAEALNKSPLSFFNSSESNGKEW